MSHTEQRSTPPATLELYFDVVCPYAWLGFRAAQQLASEHGVQLALRPILLGGVLRAVGQVDRPMDGMPPAKQAAIRADLARGARLAGVTIRYPDDHPRRTVDAMRALVLLPEERRADAADALWAAYWSDNVDLSVPAALDRVLEPFGICHADTRGAEASAALRDATEHAVARGVFGVPTFFVGQQMFWGADRLDGVRAALGIPPAARLPVGPLEVFHDFASPYSYLGVMALLDAGAQVELRPIVLGALFKAIGTPLVPVATFGAAKRAWVARDLDAQASLRGQPFRFAPRFPLDTRNALRVAIAAPEATGALYRAAWAEGVDLGDADALRRVLDDAGLDGAGLVRAADDPGVRARLRQNTAEAIEAGVVGAPTFRWRGELFWGQDRLAQLAALQRLTS